MSTFYTYAKQWGNQILYRGYKNGKQITDKIEFRPTLYIAATEESDSPWKSLYENTQLEPVEFEDIKTAKNFLETYKDVAGIEIHGFQKFEYAMINKQFPGEIDYDMTKIRTCFLDIETVDEESDKFPDIQAANVPVVLISMYNSVDGVTTVFGMKDYEAKLEDAFVYKQFCNEKDLLKAFIEFQVRHGFDVWSGWNTDGFDVPYLVNRIVRLFDDNMIKRLSPFGIVREKKVEIRGREIQTYDIFGILMLDYMLLYKKFVMEKRESYALGAIAQFELGEKKVELPGSTFRDSYLNHTATFIKYNAVDSLLVKRLDDKLKLIDLAFSIAYLAKCNLQDVFKTVVPWEVFIFNHLAEKHIPVPPRKHSMPGSIVGGWVKDSTPKMHGWMMTFDFKGLYPHIMWQWNISPETYVPSEYDLTVEDFLEDTERVRQAREYAAQCNCTLSANGTMYDKSRVGFLAELMEICINGRAIAKTEMLRLKGLHDDQYTSRIAALHNKQHALKILGNSVYGALGNEGFHYYNYRMAEAITMNGQLSDIHLSHKLSAKMNVIMGTKDKDYIPYGDTDSVFLDCESLVNKFLSNKTTKQKVEFLDKFGDEVCQPIINKSVQYIFDQTNAMKKVMGSKREAIASKMLWVAKKKYAMYVHNSEGVVYEPADLKISGIEIVRSDTPQWCRSKLKETLRMIFETDETTFRTRFAEVEKEFKTLSIEEIARPKGISDIDKYFINGKFVTGVTIPMHVRAAGLYNMHTGRIDTCQPIQNGDKMKLVYLKLPNPIRQNVIGFPQSSSLPAELKLSNYVDYDTQFFKCFEKPLTALTNIAGWNLREVASLEEFFG